jgi:hypothetical protein
VGSRRVLSRAALMFLVLAASGFALTTSAVALAKAELGNTPRCSLIPNLYKISLTGLLRCRLTEVPLSSVTALPGGGKSYNYRQPDGQVYSDIQVPEDFNPATASRAENAAYGIPPAPPRNTAGYKRWLQIESAPNATVPEHAYMIEGQQGSFTQPMVGALPAVQQASPSADSISVYPDSNWGGYEESSSGWTETENEWIEPYFGKTNCSDPQVAFWAGIGASSLAQTGTASPDYSGNLHVLFAENLPAGPQYGATVSAGSTIDALVVYNGNDSYSYTDDVNGTDHRFGGTGGYDDFGVDADTEMVDGSPLLNFNEVFMDAFVGKGLNPMLPNIEEVITGYATTGSFDDGNFEVSQNSCSGRA